MVRIKIKLMEWWWWNDGGRELLIVRQLCIQSDMHNCQLAWFVPKFKSLNILDPSKKLGTSSSQGPRNFKLIQSLVIDQWRRQRQKFWNYFRQNLGYVPVPSPQSPWVSIPWLHYCYRSESTYSSFSQSPISTSTSRLVLAVVRRGSTNINTESSKSFQFPFTKPPITAIILIK